MECHARTINELVLQDAVVKAINQMLGDKSSYQAQLQLNIASVIRASQATSVENIDEKLMALQQEFIQKAQSKEAYNEIADEYSASRTPPANHRRYCRKRRADKANQ